MSEDIKAIKNQNRELKRKLRTLESILDDTTDQLATLQVERDAAVTLLGEKERTEFEAVKKAKILQVDNKVLGAIIEGHRAKIEILSQ